MHAAEAGHMKIVQLLLMKGADVNVHLPSYRLTVSRTANDCFTLSMRETREGSTALMLAIENRHPEIVQLLLDKGSKPNEHFIYHDATTSIGNSFTAASTRLGYEVVQCGVGTPRRERVSTPLIRAVALGEVKIVSLLLNYGADVNMLDSEKLTALMHAEKRGQPDILRLLKKEGS
jgi:ankyrin repeat protein